MCWEGTALCKMLCQINKKKYASYSITKICLAYHFIGNCSISGHPSPAQANWKQGGNVLRNRIPPLHFLSICLCVFLALFCTFSNFTECAFLVHFSQFFICMFFSAHVLLAHFSHIYIWFPYIWSHFCILFGSNLRIFVIFVLIFSRFCTFLCIFSKGTLFFFCIFILPAAGRYHWKIPPSPLEGTGREQKISKYSGYITSKVAKWFMVHLPYVP